MQVNDPLPSLRTTASVSNGASPGIPERPPSATASRLPSPASCAAAAASASISRPSTAPCGLAAATRAEGPSCRHCRRRPDCRSCRDDDRRCRAAPVGARHCFVGAEEIGGEAPTRRQHRLRQRLGCLRGAVLIARIGKRGPGRNPACRQAGSRPRATRSGRRPALARRGLHRGFRRLRQCACAVSGIRKGICRNPLAGRPSARMRSSRRAVRAPVSPGRVPASRRRAGTSQSLPLSAQRYSSHGENRAAASSSAIWPICTVSPCRSWSAAPACWP